MKPIPSSAFPWTKARSIFEDAGPRGKAPVFFRIGEVKIYVRATDHVGIDTGRTRYRCECLTCGLVLHEATTGPESVIRMHLFNAHGFEL